MPVLALVDMVRIPAELVLILREFVDAVVDIAWIPLELVLMPRVFVDTLVDIV